MRSYARMWVGHKIKFELKQFKLIKKISHGTPIDMEKALYYYDLSAKKYDEESIKRFS